MEGPGITQGLVEGLFIGGGRYCRCGTGPAVIVVERDWGFIITPLEIMLLSAIVATAFVAVEHLHQITLSEGTQ
jgi:hypothetical protein